MNTQNNNANVPDDSSRQTSQPQNLQNAQTGAVETTPSDEGQGIESIGSLGLYFPRATFAQLIDTHNDKTKQYCLDLFISNLRSCAEKYLDRFESCDGAVLGYSLQGLSPRLESKKGIPNPL